MDVRVPPGIDGIQAIKRIWDRHPFVQIVICTAFSDYSWDKIIDELGFKDNLLFTKKTIWPGVAEANDGFASSQVAIGGKKQGLYGYSGIGGRKKDQDIVCNAGKNGAVEKWNRARIDPI